MSVIAIIPARMGSSRFPGKPLALINNKPMIGWVYERVAKSELLDKVIVATCDMEIMEYITSIGGEAILTSKTHERASDRCAEALLKAEADQTKKYDIVVMVQGDEPMTHPQMITEAVSPLIEDKTILVSNLMAKIKSESEFQDRNCIKVVCDLNFDALYFSREPIPTAAKLGEISKQKQVCIIPFQRDFLIEYTNMEPTPLEIFESVDMLRVLEHGKKVRMIPTQYETQAVDTLDDLNRVSKLLSGN